MKRILLHCLAALLLALLTSAAAANEPTNNPTWVDRLVSAAGEAATPQDVELLLNTAKLFGSARGMQSLLRGASRELKLSDDTSALAVDWDALATLYRNIEQYRLTELFVAGSGSLERGLAGEDWKILGMALAKWTAGQLRRSDTLLAQPTRLFEAKQVAQDVSQRRRKLDGWRIGSVIARGPVEEEIARAGQAYQSQLGNSGAKQEQARAVFAPLAELREAMGALHEAARQLGAATVLGQGDLAQLHEQWHQRLQVLDAARARASVVLKIPPRQRKP